MDPNSGLPLSPPPPPDFFACITVLSASCTGYSLGDPIAYLQGTALISRREGWEIYGADLEWIWSGSGVDLQWIWSGSGVVCWI
jgi:hypothetical protein